MNALAMDLEQTRLAANRKMAILAALDRAEVIGPEYHQAFKQGMETMLEIDGQMWGEWAEYVKGEDR